MSEHPANQNGLRNAHYNEHREHRSRRFVLNVITFTEVISTMSIVFAGSQFDVKPDKTRSTREKYAD